jgi:hypothetical protein
MENVSVVKIAEQSNNQCDSPVYVEMSPASSPVFVSKEKDSEILTQIRDKLILPELNESLIHHNTETISSTSPTALPIVIPASTSTSTSTSPPSASAEATDMVTVVVKDFTYCQEEFMKQVKENNLSISPEMIMRLLRLAMVVVDKTNESGSKKKEFVINLLKEVVMKSNDISPEDKLQALHLIMGNIVSDSIDFLIDASKGKFDVNKIENIAQEVAVSCFTRCFERFSKKK